MDSQSQAKPALAQPAPEQRGRPLGSVGARGRRQQLVAAYAEALGGKGRLTAIQAQNITRAVDLAMLAQTARADLLAGKTTINDVVKLEGAADRAVRRLNLPAPGPSKVSKRYGNAEPVPTPLQDYFAGQAEDE
jgi:hypothetical protein